MNETHDFTVEQELERHKRWLKDLHGRYYDLITAPTENEVCKALEKVYDHQVSYREDIKSFGFYEDVNNKDSWYYITYFYKETFGVSDAQTASNLLLIAKFYRG